MALPQLRKFLENPNYIDHGTYGRYRLTHYNYKERYKTLSKTFKEFPIQYFKESVTSYYVKITVPSEIKGNTYDVVFHFLTDSDTHVRSGFITDYYIQIFSNNPVFGFHFCHANYEHGLLIPCLLNKFSKKMLTVKADKYNPHDHIGYDHSLYAAGMYLLSQTRYLHKAYIDTRALPFKAEILNGMVKSLTDTIAENKTNDDRQGLKNKLNREKSLKERITAVKDEAKSKVASVKDKIENRTKTTKPSNFVGDRSSKSGVTKAKRITAKKKIGPKK